MLEVKYALNEVWVWGYVLVSVPNPKPTQVSQYAGSKICAEWGLGMRPAIYTPTLAFFFLQTIYAVLIIEFIIGTYLPTSDREGNYMYTSLIMELISRGLPVYCRWPQSTQRTGTHCWPDDEAEHTREKKNISVNYMYTFCTVAQLLTQLCNGISGFTTGHPVM